jgi:hypothetical protein
MVRLENMPTYVIPEDRIINIFDNFLKKKVGNLYLKHITDTKFGGPFWGLVDDSGRIWMEFEYTKPFRGLTNKNQPRTLYVDQSIWTLPHHYFGAGDYTGIFDFWILWAQNKYFNTINSAFHAMTYPEARPWQAFFGESGLGWEEHEANLY